MGRSRKGFRSPPDGVLTGCNRLEEGHMLYTLLVLLLIIVLAIIIWRAVAGRAV